MSSNITNQVAYLRTSREFPGDAQILSIELEKAYIDIANVVNSRTIGLFPSNRPAITGNSFFIRNNQRQQTLRQVYVFTSTAPIPHGINFTQIDYIAAMYGQYTDGTNWYGLIPGSNVAIAGQISFYLDPTNIQFLVSGAPTLTKGILIIEWMSQP